VIYRFILKNSGTEEAIIEGKSEKERESLKRMISLEKIPWKKSSGK
jgi:hypothetical protein